MFRVSAAEGGFYRVLEFLIPPSRYMHQMQPDAVHSGKRMNLHVIMQYHKTSVQVVAAAPEAARTMFLCDCESLSFFDFSFQRCVESDVCAAQGRYIRADYQPLLCLVVTRMALLL